MDTEISSETAPVKYEDIDYSKYNNLSQERYALPLRIRRRIHRITPYAWVRCSDDTFVLSFMKKGVIKIRPSKKYSSEGLALPLNIRNRADSIVAVDVDTEATYTYSASYSPSDRYKPPKPILASSGLDSAIRQCDAYAERHVITERFAQR